MKIKYAFANGESIEVEVSQDLFEAIQEIDRVATNRNRVERRKHCSFEYKAAMGFDLPDTTAVGPLQSLLEQEQSDALHHAFKKLLPHQQELVHKVFFEGRTLTSIAREEGVGVSAIKDRLLRIMNKMRTFFN